MKSSTHLALTPIFMRVDFMVMKFLMNSLKSRYLQKKS